MRHAITGALGCLFAISAVVQMNAQRPTAAKAMDGLAATDYRYRIGLQDVLAVHVFKHPELEQRVAVSPGGTISLVRIERPLVAACKTETELAADIRNAYMESILRDPEVTVTVAEQKSQYIGVLGAVEHPGMVYISRRVHLLEVLAQVGGPNKDAGTRLIVFRGGSSANCKDPNAADEDVALVDLKIRDIQQGKKVFWMQPGDVVSVLDADIVYVYGNVNKQGAFPVREPITLTQAIVKAEGLKGAAKRDKVRILRQKGDSPEREELVFDLRTIDKGTTADPILQPNDIVAVSEDRTKAIMLSIGGALQNSIPSAIYRIP